MKIRIRGVYATALTKLSLEWGFKIVQPTEKIKERFSLEEDLSPPDVTVKDHESRSGTVIIGKCDPLRSFVEKLVEYLDPFVVYSDMGLHDIFMGKVLEGGLVEAPGGLTLRVPPPYLPTVGSTQIFTVVRPPIGQEVGVAVPEIVVEGDYIELNTMGGVRYSRHIPQVDRTRLGVIASKLRLGGLGIKFKSSARYVSEDVLTQEAERLYQEIQSLAGGSGILKRGRCIAVVLFDKQTKERLDAVRSTVVPTIRGHHALRTQGMGRCLDLLDHMGADVYEKAAAFLARGYIELWHIKPWGEVIKMRGEALGFKDGVLVVKRALKPGGVLDGIGVKIDKGYYALTCISRHVVHTYYT
ncbi:MAG: RNA-binding protein, partial [Pyrobaculum sp.]